MERECLHKEEELLFSHGVVDSEILEPIFGCQTMIC